VLPTGLLHAAAGVPQEQQRNIPAIYEDFREATYDQKARLVDMNTNHVEIAINYPNIFLARRPGASPSAGQGSACCASGSTTTG
jgi:hypothetical protein